MNFKSRYILVVAALIPAFSAGAQDWQNNNFSIKASADIDLVNNMKIDCALPNMSTKSSSSYFGIDFGWTFWKQCNSSFEANIGLGYGRTSLKAKLPELDYHYSAPAAADMDNEPYIRYYELDGLKQTITTDRLAVPIYVTYHYHFNEILSVHALVGLKVAFNVSSKIAKSEGNAFSYGVYPQYDNLMIDAPYMNCFGESRLESDQTLKPKVYLASPSLMAGVGAEVRIWGPISADLTIKYEEVVSNMYKWTASKNSDFNAENAPVRYTVAEGQKVTPLSSYLTTSTLSRLNCSISLLYRF